MLSTPGFKPYSEVCVKDMTKSQLRKSSCLKVLWTKVFSEPTLFLTRGTHVTKHFPSETVLFISPNVFILYMFPLPCPS